MLACLATLTSCKDGFYGNEIIIEEGSKEIKFSVCGVDTYNPILTKSESMRELLSLVYSPLYTFDEKLRPIGCLADSLEKISDVEVKLSLKKNLSWHSGEPFTADDVIYTIDTIRQNPDSFYYSSLNSISGAYTNENGELILTLKYPVMNIEGLLSFPIIRNGSSNEIDDMADGLGIYEIKEKSASELLLLSRENGEDKAPAVRVSIMRTPDACVSAFETGELDFITSAVLNLDEKTPAGKISKHLYASNNLTFLGFNDTLPKYSTPYLRIAVSNIIDREKIVSNGVYGMGVEAELPIHPSSTLYIKTEFLEYDIDGSIKEAGYSKKGGKYLNEYSEPLTADILVCEEDSCKVDIANIISEELKEAGFSSSVIVSDFATYKRRVENKDFDMFIGEVKMPYNLDPGFLTENGNFFGYSNAELDELLAQMRLTGSLAELSEYMKSYERIFKNDQPFAPLFYKCEGIIYKKNISGITEQNFYAHLNGIDKLYFSNTVER